jgi:hypothetical protein
MKNLLMFLRDTLYIPLASSVMWLNSVLVNSTVKLEVIGEDTLNKLHAEGKQLIFAFWHQATFTMFYYYRGKKMCALPVDNYLGKTLAGFLRKYGYKTITYPERGTPLQRVEAIAKLLKGIREGHDCGIAVDGPPDEYLFKAKPGVFYLASRSGAPIIPSAIYYKNAFTMNFRWDKYLVPRLFSRAVLYLGEPIYVNESVFEKNVDPMLKKLEETLYNLTAKAKEICLSK